MRQEIKQLYKYLKTKPTKTISSIIPYKFKRPLKYFSTNNLEKKKKKKGGLTIGRDLQKLKLFF